MKNTFLRLWAWITGSSVALFNFLAPILASSAATLLEQLAPIALDVVLSMADSKATGEIKRKQAVDEIQARAIATGIQASTSVVNATVELALQTSSLAAKCNETVVFIPHDSCRACVRHPCHRRHLFQVRRAGIRGRNHRRNPCGNRARLDGRHHLRTHSRKRSNRQNHSRGTL